MDANLRRRNFADLGPIRPKRGGRQYFLVHQIDNGEIGPPKADRDRFSDRRARHDTRVSLDLRFRFDKLVVSSGNGEPIQTSATLDLQSSSNVGKGKNGL